MSEGRYRRYARSQERKRRYVLVGLVVSLVSAGIIGVALATFLCSWTAGFAVGLCCFIYCNVIYFSGKL